MIVTKKSEFKFEVTFNESEVKKLEDIEDVFEVTPEDVIKNSVDESLRLGIAGVHNLINIVTNKNRK